jgi:NADPH-dependent 2,4-dienoyl-CoA reductase/sulfur reductase-like enzyme
MMETIRKDVVIIGGGPAGLASALELYRRGIKDIVLIERDETLGGILNQCIHDGFGLIRFGETLTGPEYASRFIQDIREGNLPVHSGAMVVDLTRDKELTVASREGWHKYQARAVILAMGCRERTRGALSIPGSRPAGIYTAGVAQNLVNMKNIMVGKRVVILGSGDIGLIMARRLTLEGAKVLAVVEKLPYSSGLPRNISQCLDDFGIPLLLNHTVTRIVGKHRLERVYVSELDREGRVKKGKTQRIDCDTLILSVGLIPENELSLDAGIELYPPTGGPLVDEHLQTTVEGVFACGNVLHVHDLVDYVSDEGERAARSVARYLDSPKGLEKCTVPVHRGDGIRYVLPQYISAGRPVDMSMRVMAPCRNREIVFLDGYREVKVFKRRRLHPAEMVRLKLTEKDLDGVQSLKVVVR